MEDLALGLLISVVASIHLAVTGEGGLGGLGVDGVVLAGNSGNSVHQHLERVGLGITGRSVKVVLIVAVKSLISLRVGVERLLGLVDWDLVGRSWSKVGVVSLGSRVVLRVLLSVLLRVVRVVSGSSSRSKVSVLELSSSGDRSEVGVVELLGLLGDGVEGRGRGGGLGWRRDVAVWSWGQVSASLLQ